MNALAPSPHSKAAGIPKERVAIKVQRRRYASSGLEEIAIHERIDRREPGTGFVIGMNESFMHDGHVCQVFELHGETASDCIKDKPLSVGDVKRLARQVLEALAAMHRIGLVHTDIKPQNLLWCSRKREARVIDLGCAEARLRVGEAIATREYSPPEMLIGNPMAAPVDLWSLGCTLFELVTGEVLFDPWQVCEQKYSEFAEDDETQSSPPDADDLSEAAEQLAAGELVQGKYRLIKPLGRGKFGTVWEAEMLHSRSLNSSLPTADEAKSMSREARTPKIASNGFNLYQIALNYEHFILMQECLGPFPEHLAKSGSFRHILYDSEGTLRFQPSINSKPILTRLLATNLLTPDECNDMAAFLEGLLRLDPDERLTASEALSIFC